MDALLDLRGRTVVVTGAGGGIGSAIVQILTSRGATCVACDREGSLPLQRPKFISCDLSSPHGCEVLFDRIEGLFPDIDSLVNCAGIYPRVDLMRGLSAEVLGSTFALNTFAPMQLSRRLVLYLADKKRPGCVVNVASDAWFKSPTLGPHYAGSKAALVAMSRSLAKATGPRGIRVNSVSPGMTRTGQPGLNDKQFAEEGRCHPLGRVAEPEDVAYAVLFLLSDMAAYINGHDLVVNGGSVPR